MKKHLALLAKLAVMAALLAALYRHVDFAAFQSALAGLKWGWLPLIYVLFLLNTSLSAWKWKMLLASDGVSVPLPSLFASYLIGTFFNLFLPSSIGGDSYRVVDASRHGGAAKSFASVFADRLTGFLALAIWGLLFSALGWSRLPDKRILWLPVLVFGLMAAMVFALVQRRALVAVLRAFRIDRLKKLDAFIHRVLDSMAAYHGDRALLAKVFGISLFFQMMAIVIIFCISKAMGWQVPFIYFSIFVPLITLGEALPISIFGIGVRDSLYVFFFAQGGASREQALAMALVYVLLTLVYSLLGGVLFLLRRPAPGAAE
ncbi:MAG: flippase-like domain-containing protein [Opitutae bacterium]|nr:flippase-like domain-containing protein [Opitutae bacterium]